MTATRLFPQKSRIGRLDTRPMRKKLSFNSSGWFLKQIFRSFSNMWPRQNSLSLKEWDIPYDDLHLKEEIGHGRFGTVYRALWHGDVAVKLLKEDYLDDNTLEAFKLEVATFKKTRHDNLVLFMGACMKPPRLAIVTSLCKGNTLYTHIYLRKDKFNLNRTTLISQQISQVNI